MENANQQVNTPKIPTYLLQHPINNQIGNFPIILGVLVLLIIFGGGVYYLRSSYNKFNSQPQSQTTNTTQNTSTNNPVSFDTMTLMNSLNDSQSELIFSEGKQIYSVKLDGSQPTKMAQMDDYVGSLRFLPGKEDLFIGTQRPVQTSGTTPLPDRIDPNTGQWIYKTFPQLELNEARWILKANSQKPEKLINNTSLPFDLQTVQELARSEIIYAKANASGTFDLFADKLDGSPPIQVGTLKVKPLERNKCGYEIDTKGDAACVEKYAPSAYLPSFDGSYLLNIPQRGGGLGEPALVISKDGSKFYKINFYWYVASAVWIDNNKLLTKDQNGIKIFTFNNDGTFTKKDLLENIVGDQFSQPSLSPNRKLLASIAANPNELVLLDVDQLTKKSIEKGSQTLGVIGWNNNSTKLLYSSFARSNSKEIKLYDIKTGTLSTIAKLSPEPQDWVKINRGTFGNTIFDIR